MTSQELKRWLQKEGCTFEPGHGGHLIVRRGSRMSVLPMHGKQRELGTGLVNRWHQDHPERDPRVVSAEEGKGLMDYPITLERDDNHTILVTFHDFPEAHTFGNDVPDALAHAKDALATAIDAYIKDHRDIPLPSAIVTKYRVTAPALVEAKVRLYETMRAARVGKSELARRLDWHLPQVDRLLEMTHASKLGQLEAAFCALGKRLVVGVEDVRATKTATKRRESHRRIGGRRGHVRSSTRDRSSTR